MPVQTTYEEIAPKGIEGHLSNTTRADIKAKIALTIFAFGVGLVIRSNDGKLVSPPSANVFNLSGDITTGKTLTGTVTVRKLVNGELEETENAVSVAYNTSHDNTMDLIVTQLEGFDDIASCDLTDDTNNREITVNPGDGVEVELSGFVITGLTVAYDTTDEVKFVAGDKVKECESDGTVQYNPGDEVNALRKGAIFVQSAVATTAMDDVFCRFIDGGGADQERGKFSNVSTNAIPVINASFISSAGANEVNELELG